MSDSPNNPEADGPQPVSSQPGSPQPQPTSTFAAAVTASEPAAPVATSQSDVTQPDVAQAPVAEAAGVPSPAPQPVAHKTIRPVRGVLWGIMFGLGLTIVAIVTRMIALSLGPALVVLIAGIAIGTLWSLFGPAKPAPS